MYIVPVARQTLGTRGELLLPEAVRAYVDVDFGDSLEFVTLPGCRVLVGRVSTGAGRPIRPAGVVTSSGTISIPLMIQRHMQIGPGDDIEFLRLESGGLELEKADSPRQRGGPSSRDSLGDRGPGRGLDMLVSISLPEE